MPSSPGGRAPTSGPASTIKPTCCTWRAWLALPAPPPGFGSSTARRANRAVGPVARDAPASGHRCHAAGCRGRAAHGAAADRSGAATIARRDARLAHAVERRAGRFCRSMPPRGSRCSRKWPRSATNWPTWISACCTTRRAICSPSATTSASGGSMPASTICWPPKRGWPASSSIAQGKFGQEHWFALGRLLTSDGQRAGAVELERLDVRVPDAAAGDAHLREHAARPHLHAVVRRQIEYGRQRGVPWGISESGYNTIDQHKNYQYRAFGVPGLGLKRGLAEDLVIAPYASALALMVAPEAACRNLERLAADGQQGAYGFYEAVDYTPSRLPPGASSVTVRQFMAHHEGMSLLSLAYLLLDKPMQRRFLADPMLRAADLLLQERVPKAVAPVFPHASRSQRHARSLRPKKRAACASSPIPSSAAVGSPSALQRPLPRRRDQRRRRLQPLARPGGDALARGCHARLLRQLLLSARSGQRRALVQRLAADARSPPSATKRSSRRRGPSSAAATTRSRRTPRSASRPRTTSNCGESR